MPYAPADGTGRIFDNREDKRTARSPDYTGTMNVNGQIFRVIAWHNPPTDRVKKANINLKFQDKAEFDLEQQAKREERRPAPPPFDEEIGDEIPF